MLSFYKNKSTIIFEGTNINLGNQNKYAQIRYTDVKMVQIIPFFKGAL